MAVLLAQAMVVLLAQAILASPFEADPLVQTSPAANAEVVSGTSVTIRWRTPSALAPRERIKVYLTSAIAVVSPPPAPRSPQNTSPARPPAHPPIHHPGTLCPLPSNRLPSYSPSDGWFLGSFPQMITNLRVFPLVTRWPMSPLLVPSLQPGIDSIPSHTHTHARARAHTPPSLPTPSLRSPLPRVSSSSTDLPGGLLLLLRYLRRTGATSTSTSSGRTLIVQRVSSHGKSRRTP